MLPDDPTRASTIRTMTPMATNHQRGLVAPVRCTALASYCRTSRVWVLSRRLCFSCLASERSFYMSFAISFISLRLLSCHS
ncbi:hypothetical protein ED312_02815 [Sinomicrobium pectinilyticum]|uniref:Uncharacterized protein n=1 Tax=Sinomicrobium pectinilyticum TaxID=1084421 RepID=A0A3N0EZX2_SINP1|nr:hypothetical protein ED312_02815 [Sinomicrobium pectinilyticum]